MKKAVFLGTPAFALPSFEATTRSTELLAVITQPDRPRGRGQKLQACEVKAAALARGLRCFSPPSLRKDSDELRELQAFMATARPDLLIVTAYGNLLPQSFLDWPRIGPINVHASLLPRWRGAAPIQRALEAGDGETGVALQRMVAELDAGDVLAEARTPIDPQEDAIELSRRLSQMGGALLETYLRQNLDELRGQPQDPARVTLAPKIKKEEGFWSPEWTAAETHNRIRAFAQWPGVKALFQGEELKLLKTSLPSSKAGLQPGELTLSTDNEVLFGVRAGESLRLEKVQAPNRSPVQAAEFLRSLKAGTGAPRQEKLQLLEIKASRL